MMCITLIQNISTMFIQPRTKSRWRELAGIHIEYALPEGKLDPVETIAFVRKRVARTFSIGNIHSPTLWTSSTPPDVRITTGGPNAGFTSLSAALDYLQSHPKETVWVMNWDAPSRPLDRQINENLVLLVLAGPDYKTERAPLAWLGYPSTKQAADFEAKKGEPPRLVQAWTAAIEEAAAKANRRRYGDRLSDPRRRQYTQGFVRTARCAGADAHPAIAGIRFPQTKLQSDRRAGRDGRGHRPDERGAGHRLRAPFW